jgi:ribose transport system ATP-binding protein
MDLVSKNLAIQTREELPSVISASGIKKSFSGIEVLHGIDFVLKKGEIHGLAGANGAGKSTLMKILNGVYIRDSGIIKVNHKKVDYKTPIGAREAGISMVFQEFSLIQTLTVAANLFLGREPCYNKIFIDHKKIVKITREIFSELDVNIDPFEDVANLSVGNQQIVEIAKALSQNASILILDEPTASLSHREIESLFKIIKKLKNNGISIIIVTHHLQEILDICDWVTILRDGNLSLSKSLHKVELQNIIEAMIGRKIGIKELSRFIERDSVNRDITLMEVNNLNIKSQVKDISFKLNQGEVLGIAGVLGSGRTELLEAIYGIIKKDSGKIIIKNNIVNIKHPADAQKYGITLVPEHRHKDGIIKGQSVRMNILLPIWKKLSKCMLIDDKKGKEKVNTLIKKLRIKVTNSEQNIEFLSGGNQQKAVIAKSLVGDAQILLLDDPTVGVDVEAKHEIIYTIILLAKEKRGIIFVSSEFEQLANVCDRVIIMRKGKIVRIFDRNNGDIITEAVLLEASQANVPENC